MIHLGNTSVESESDRSIQKQDAIALVVPLAAFAMMCSRRLEGIALPTPAVSRFDSIFVFSLQVTFRCSIGSPTVRYTARIRLASSIVTDPDTAY